MIYMSFLVINVTWAAKGGSKYMLYFFHELLRTTEILELLSCVSREISRTGKTALQKLHVSYAAHKDKILTEHLCPKNLSKVTSQCNAPAYNTKALNVLFNLLKIPSLLKPLKADNF